VTDKIEEVKIISNLNETLNGELLAKNVEVDLPWWLKIFGLKPKPMINKIIATDYVNYAVIYLCNEFNTWLRHDEVYYLLRDLKSNSQFINQAYMIINKTGFDSNKMKKIDQESKICQ
jgi:hypothetical protein